MGKQQGAERVRIPPPHAVPLMTGTLRGSHVRAQRGHPVLAGSHSRHQAQSPCCTDWVLLQVSHHGLSMSVPHRTLVLRPTIQAGAVPQAGEGPCGRGTGTGVPACGRYLPPQGHQRGCTESTLASVSCLSLHARQPGRRRGGRPGAGLGERPQGQATLPDSRPPWSSRCQVSC